MIEAKLLPNASYFAFTATPEEQDAQLFRIPEPGQDGKVRHRPFPPAHDEAGHSGRLPSSTCSSTTPVASYYKLVKEIRGRPRSSTPSALQEEAAPLRGSHDHAIGSAEIMVDHGRCSRRARSAEQARAMVVTSGIEQAIQYFHAIRDYLIERKSPYKAIVAFSGRARIRRRQVTERR
ncbi:MAG: hypothetical protein U0704_05715 [Candidatus Eisenbacteria bacterium]